MKKVRSPSQANLYQFIFHSSLLVLFTLAVFAITSCRTNKSGFGSYRYNPQDTVPYIPGTTPHLSSTFYKLRMSRRQFETLKSYSGNTLVFQFFYPSASNCGSPTLFTYKMKKRHRATGTPPEVLSYGEAAQEPLKGRNQVLGDLQIKISKLNDLISRVTKSKNGNFNNLVFTPRFVQDNPHEVYDISVDGSSEFETANPSPPF